MHLSHETPGLPTAIHGTAILLAEDGGTREAVELDVRVEIPVVGGKLESIVSDRIRTSPGGEHRAGVRWLEGDPA